MVAETAPFGYGLYFTFEEAAEGIYQMTGEPGINGDGSTYDMDANDAGYVAISPIPTSMSDDRSLSKLRSVFNEYKIPNSK